MRVIKDSTTPQNVLPHYLVKPMTSKIDAVSRHNAENSCLFGTVNAGLPRWLSGLSHSAHRPERPAGGSGVQSPVGR